MYQDFQLQPELGAFVVHANAGGPGNFSVQGRGRGGRGSGGHLPAEFSGARGNYSGAANPSAYNQAGGGLLWSMQGGQTSALLLQSASGSSKSGSALPVNSNLISSLLNSAGASQQIPSTEDAYEVHDNQLKAPVSIRRQDVVATVGSFRLFSAPPQQLNGPGQGPSGGQQRNAPRICEPFQQGQCLHGEECPDIHVAVDVMQSMRHQMVSWLLSREAEFGDTAAAHPDTTFRVFAADLKEVVDVPINALSFTRGLYVDPSARAKRSRFGQQSAFALMAAQVPTACGLYSVDPSQCKWGRWCNQAHIEPFWMRMKRGEFENWSRSLEQQFEDMVDEHVFVVHDPQTKTSLQIPKVAVAGFSRGLFQGSAKKAPSVCMLYQRGRCTAGTCCNQIHVFPECLQLIRQYQVEGNPELIFAMQQIALQQRQLLLMTQQQQQVQNAMMGLTLPAAAVVGIGGGLAQQPSAPHMQGNLNPGARPFVPPGYHGSSGPTPSQPFSSHNSNSHSPNNLQRPQQQDYSQQQQDPQKVEQQPHPYSQTNFAPFSNAPGESSHAKPTSTFGAIHVGSFGGSSMTSPPLIPRSPAMMSARPYSTAGITNSPSAKGLVSPLTDLRCEEDEVFERRRQVAAATPTTPIKQNNPYQQTSQHAQKPIGVPPSPLHGVALPPPLATHMSQLPPQAHSGHAGHHSAAVPHTPPMQFGWMPQARMPPPMGNSLPPPPSPFRSTALKTPTSPQYPPPFTPDLSHVQFSPSPLLRSAESITHIPKTISLEGFDELHLQQSLSHPTLPGSYAGNAHQGHPAAASMAGSWGGHHPIASSYTASSGSPGSWLPGTIRQGQPYQQAGSSATTSSTPTSRGTPVEQRQ